MKLSFFLTGLLAIQLSKPDLYLIFFPKRKFRQLTFTTGKKETKTLMTTTVTGIFAYWREVGKAYRQFVFKAPGLSLVWNRWQEKP